jgi:hypothetical protein
MIKEIENHLGNVDVTINISKIGDEFVLSVLPKPKTEDPIKECLDPFIIKGIDPVEVEKLLNKFLTEVIPSVEETTNSINHYLDTVNEMKANSKAEKDSKKKSDADAIKINKELGVFDELIAEKKFDEAKKLIDKVSKIDASNKHIIKAIDTLSKAKLDSSNDLFSVAESSEMVEVKPIKSIAMNEDEIQLATESRSSNMFSL